MGVPRGGVHRKHRVTDEEPAEKPPAPEWYFCGICVGREWVVCWSCWDGCETCGGTGRLKCEGCNGGYNPPPPPDWI